MTRGQFMKKTVEKLTDELYPSYSYVGGYTIVYYDETDGSVLCGKCAMQGDIQTLLNEYEYKIHQMFYDEGPNIFCDECNAEIESSYGEVE